MFDKLIKKFRESYGDDYYDKIEKESGLIGKKVVLKNQEDFIGKIKCLWLPENEESYRKSHLWYIQWDNGSTGIVESRGLII